MKKALYAFSGDPITFGHIDIITRTAGVFDEVIVGIGSNPDKSYMFSLEERTEMAERSLAGITNARVRPFSGLLVDYAYEQNISTIVKGVRNTADFNYENTLHQVGESQKLGIDTFILFAKPELAHISSGAVKSVQKEHGFIHEYVPLYVKQCLERKMARQFILGVTGEIGAGKSYVTDIMVETIKKKGVDCYNIDLDKIGHQILEELREPKYQKIRDTIAARFGKQIKLPSGMINRKKLGQIVFNNPDDLKDLNRIMRDPILVRLKREIADKAGILILNGALLAEAQTTHLCNNNLVLVTCEKSIQEKRLRERGLDKSQIIRRIRSQYSFAQKKEIITAKIEKDMQGKLWIIDNSEHLPMNKVGDVCTWAVRGLGRE